MNHSSLISKQTILLLVLYFFVGTGFAEVIKKSGESIADNKEKACKKALLNAKREALHQAGVNIFTKVETKTTVTNEDKIKKQFINKTQESFGSVKVINHTKNTSYNKKTGLITCKVEGSFEIDTSKLEDQLIALQKKYENIEKEENDRTQALKEKNELMEKYKVLKNDMKEQQTFFYDGKYDCGEVLSPLECKQKLKKKIRNFFKKNVAKKFNIEEDLFNVSEIELDREIEVSSSGNTIIANYSGDVSADVLSVKNPFMDNINSLNTYLGERQQSLTNKEHGVNLSSKKNDNKFKNLLFYGIGTNTAYFLEYLRPLKNKNLSIKLAIGKEDFSKETKVEKNKNGYSKKYSYDFLSVGAEYIFNKTLIRRSELIYTIGLDYIIPSNFEGREKTYSYKRKKVADGFNFFGFPRYKYIDVKTLISDEKIKGIDPFMSLNLNMRIGDFRVGISSRNSPTSKIDISNKSYITIGLSYGIRF